MLFLEAVIIYYMDEIGAVLLLIDYSSRNIGNTREVDSEICITYKLLCVICVGICEYLHVI